MPFYAVTYLLKIRTQKFYIRKFLQEIFKSGMVFAVMGAAAAVILPGIGSAIGIGYTASASAGVMTEDPRNFGKYLILVALPGTQGIYGFVAAFLVIMNLGLISSDTAKVVIDNMSRGQGLQVMYSCLPIAFAGLVSAIHQGRVCAAGVGLTAKQPAESLHLQAAQVARLVG